MRIGKLQITVRGEMLVNKYKIECREIVRSICSSPTHCKMLIKIYLIATIILVAVEKYKNILAPDILWNFDQYAFSIWKIRVNDKENAVNNLTLAKR